MIYSHVLLNNYTWNKTYVFERGYIYIIFHAECSQGSEMHHANQMDLFLKLVGETAIFFLHIYYFLDNIICKSLAVKPSATVSNDQP